jgi:hypothetical protein
VVRATRKCPDSRALGRAGDHSDRFGSITRRRPQDAAATKPWSGVELWAALVIAKTVAAPIRREGLARNRQSKNYGRGVRLVKTKSITAASYG